MKKKILTYMMTAMVMLGCAGLSNPITAYAGEDIRVHNFSTGETYTEHVDEMTDEEKANALVSRMRNFGKSDAEIIAELQRQGLPTSVLGGTSTSTSAISSNTTSNAASTNTTQNSAAPKKPTYTQEQIDAAWEETERTESTCVVAGSVVYKNSLTGATKTEELPLVDHDYQETANVAATCTEDGHITTTCSICGDEQTKTVKATGHQTGSAVVAKQAGLFSEGESTVSCTECGELLSSEVLPQTCPLPLAAVIGIAVATVAAIAGVVFAVVHKKKAAVAE
ncbi:MAG: hypothetical protein IKR14_02765 [Lachnospiraceae bacterium]|nr:hypothetical protein [Lachnospiraceae bacterium]